MIKDKIKKLKDDYDKNLKAIQKKCTHEWIEDGTTVHGWWSVQCYRCEICGKTKEGDDEG